MMKVTPLLWLLSALCLQLFAQHDPVTLQLQWRHQFQFAGFYVAKERGFYREAGLDVTIKEYTPGVNVVEEVVAKDAHYGIGRSSLLLQRAGGTPVVALAAIYEHSPSVLITTDPSIVSPKDFNGRKIMMTKDEADSAAIMSMLLTHGVKKEQLILQPHSADYRDLVNGKTDAMAGYRSNEPYLLDEQHVAYKIFDPKESGFDFYGDILFTSEHELRSHPDRARKFYDASMRGWQWAFEHIEETAALIREKYNTQHKSLDALIYEGKTLKPLSTFKAGHFGFLSKNRFQQIAEVYRLSGRLQTPVDYDAFLNPTNLGKRKVRIGILAKRGKENTKHRWIPLMRYLEERLPYYHFEVVPLDFSEFETQLESQGVDFIFTNTMFYVQLEHKYGISRIATLLNAGSDELHPLKTFGGVIFTQSDNNLINRIGDLKGRRFAAVNPRSFGGWVMGYEILKQKGLDTSDLDLYFLNTHDNVVYSVINGMYDAGTVRTDTLERMAREGRIDLSKVKLLHPQTYPDFPYLVSTRLYPEWPFAKLPHTSNKLAHEVVAALIEITPDSEVAQKTQVGGWTIPVSYSSVHNVLKTLRLPPYDKHDVTLEEIFEEYSPWIYLGIALIALILMQLMHTRRTNRLLKKYNRELDAKVHERTLELQAANEQLKALARTDTLTQLHNRLYFMEMAEQYYDVARRNGTPLQILMLDIDHFKQINDTYGHQTGDEILKLFASTISAMLRRSDIFGRIGGEEFAIVLQNTSAKGAHEFAQRMRQAIENLRYSPADSKLEPVTFTVSIGIAERTEENDLKALLKQADQALYRAKEEGRNAVRVYRE